MSIRVWGAVILTSLVLVAAGCASLSREEVMVDKQATTVSMPDTGSIPSDWGQLVSVTNAPQTSNQFHLWFQDEAGTVRLAVYDIRNRRLLSTGWVFERR
jgi:hypothetical protein